MIGQLPLDLPHRPSFAEEDFLAAASNERARALLRLWPDWPHRLLLLTGPKGAGKSHLGAIWARRAGGRVVSARDLSIETLPEIVSAPALLIEDADSPPLREKELFHLINLAMERGTFLLVTARKSPDAWGLSTKDLLSRLRRAPAVAIEQPDDDFLRAILAKLFHDRQIAVDSSLIDFLVLRLERSFEAAQQIVATLDRVALARGRPVTRSLASDLLAASPDDEEINPSDPDNGDTEQPQSR
jgi:chromosomal replication initiation ATPase DnaA